MRLTCPACGERDHAEFSYRGDAAPRRPALRETPEAGAPPPPALLDYVYIRDNPHGLVRELWQHTGGCRCWLVVERDITNHSLGSVRFARGASAR